MPAYKAYAWEREAYPAFQTIIIEDDDRKKYLDKLSRHFKVADVILSQSLQRGFGAGRSTWVSWYRTSVIRLHKRTTLGTLCHEFAHHLVMVRWGKQRIHHGRKFKRELKRVYTFAKRYLPQSEPVVA